MTNIWLHQVQRCAVHKWPITVGANKVFPKMVSLRHRPRWVPGWIIAHGCLVGLALIVPSLTGCGTAEEQGALTPTKATVSLLWDPVNDPSVVGYYIHYGKNSPNQPGSCSYERAKFIEASQGIVTGLDQGSTYYFAVSAYNGERSNCSNEVSTQT